MDCRFKATLKFFPHFWILIKFLWWEPWQLHHCLSVSLLVRTSAKGFQAVRIFFFLRWVWPRNLTWSARKHRIAIWIFSSNIDNVSLAVFPFSISAKILLFHSHSYLHSSFLQLFVDCRNIFQEVQPSAVCKLQSLQTRVQFAWVSFWSHCSSNCNFSLVCEASNWLISSGTFKSFPLAVLILEDTFCTLNLIPCSMHQCYEPFVLQKSLYYVPTFWLYRNCIYLNSSQQITNKRN